MRHFAVELEELNQALLSMGALVESSIHCSVQALVNRDERMAFAEAAHVLRFADAEGNVDTPIKPEQLLQVRRADDNERNLWTDFNVVQENVIRGGLKGRVPATGGGTRRMSTRGINGIDQDVRLNKALWVLGQRMAALKGVEVKTAA